MTPRRVTLPEILEARDARHARQLEWLKRHGTLLVLTVVMPGSVKRDEVSDIIARAAVECLKQDFAQHISALETFDLDTGFEAFMLIDLPANEVKLRACKLEQAHPLGRLFDIDVLDKSGVPVSRTALGVPARRCLICGNDARICMRTGAHSYDDLLAHIHEMVNQYASK